MTRDDVDPVLAVEESSFPTPWSRQAFLSEIGNEGFSRYYVAELSEKIVGYAGMWIIVDEAHITNIAVHPDYRGRKIGQALLCQIIKDAMSAGCSGVTLEVRVSNTVALNLYRKHGFVKQGIRPGYYTDTNEDAWIMWKWFSDAGQEK